MKSKKRLLFGRKASKDGISKKSECSGEDTAIGELINWTDSFGFTAKNLDKLDIEYEVNRIKKLMTVDEREIEVLGQDKIEIEKNALNFQEIKADHCSVPLLGDKFLKKINVDIDDDPLSVAEIAFIEVSAPHESNQHQTLDVLDPTPDPSEQSTSSLRAEATQNPIIMHHSISQSTSAHDLHAQHEPCVDSDIDFKVNESIMNVLNDNDDTLCDDDIRIDVNIDDLLPADVQNVAKVMMAVLTGNTLISHILPPKTLPPSISHLPTPLSHLLSVRPHTSMPATHHSHCMPRYTVSDRLDDSMLIRCLDADISQSDECSHADVVCRYVRRRCMLVCHADVADIVVMAMRGTVKRSDSDAGDLFLEVSRAWKKVRQGVLGIEQKEVATLVWIECALEYLKVCTSRGNQELIETIIKLISQHTYELPQDKSKSIAVRFRLFREAYSTSMQPQPDSEQNTFFNSFINRFVKI